MSSEDKILNNEDEKRFYVESVNNARSTINILLFALRQAAIVNKVDNFIIEVAKRLTDAVEKYNYYLEKCSENANKCSEFVNDAESDFMEDVDGAQQ